MDTVSKWTDESTEDTIVRLQQRLTVMEDFVEAIINHSNIPKESAVYKKMAEWVNGRRMGRFCIRADQYVKREDHHRHQWIARHGRKSTPKFTTKCAYCGCNHQVTVKLKDMKVQAQEDPEALGTQFCSEACAARFWALEDLHNDWLMYQAGQISESEWNALCQKAKSAHLRLIE